MYHQLSDRELLSYLEDLASKENEATFKYLNCLAELDKRKLYLKFGYSSLFVLCTQKLKYSEAAAYRRICSARIIRQHPKAGRLFQARLVSLTTLTQINPILSPNNATQILKSIAGKSTKEIEKIVALHKKPESPKHETVRVIAVTTQPKVTSVNGSEFVSVPNNLPVPIEKSLSPPMPQVNSPTSSPAQSATQLKYKINFEANEELVKKLRRLKEIRPYKNLEELFELLLDNYLKQHAPENKNHSVKASKSRIAPPNLRAMVLSRDNYQCSFVSNTGERCDCRSDLEIDHIRPAALGGKTESGNLRTLCSAHNRYEAERVLGQGVYRKLSARIDI